MKSGCLLKSVISKIYVSNIDFHSFLRDKVLQCCCQTIPAQQIILQIKQDVTETA